MTNRNEDRWAGKQLGLVADALPLADWTPGDGTHADAVARVVAQRDRHRDTLRRMHAWLVTCTESSGRADGVFAARQSLENTEPWLLLEAQP
jgi:hypothetical protein